MSLFDSPRLLLSCCALFWAGNFVLGRAVHDAIPPVALAFWRWAGACLLVLPFVWRSMYAQRELLREHVWRLSVLALLGVAGFNTFVYQALQTTTATNSVLIQSTLPVQILLLNWVLFRVPAHARELTSILLSLAGVLIIITAGKPWLLLRGVGHPGDLWALGAALDWALYSVLLRWRPASLQPQAFLGFTLLAGWLMLLPLYLLEQQDSTPLSWSPEVFASILYLAVFPSALAYLFWNRGVALIGPAAAGHFAHLMPVFGSLLAVGFLGETFGWYHLLGAALVASGILMTWRATSARRA